MNPLLHRLGLTVPILQAPMAGVDSPALAAAVSTAGGLGSFGAAYLSPTAITEAIASIAALTNRAYAINLFAPTPPPPTLPPEALLAALAPYHAALGVAAPTPPPPPDPATFTAQLRAVLDSPAAVLSFTFGLLPPEAIAAARDRGKILIGTATTVREAILLAESGVDAITAQGAEAGGHRGSFAAPFGRAMIGTMALVPQIVDAVALPVIASGGIMDGRGIAAALMLGAGAVQMGTAFLACDEASASDAQKEALLAANAEDTVITSAFSGRPARAIANRFTAEMEGAANLGFPDQNTATKPLRAAATAQGRTEFMSLWAGQGAKLARRQSAASLMQFLSEDTQAAFRQSGLMPG